MAADTLEDHSKVCVETGGETLRALTVAVLNLHGFRHEGEPSDVCEHDRRAALRAAGTVRGRRGVVAFLGCEVVDEDAREKREEFILRRLDDVDVTGFGNCFILLSF